MEFSRGEGGPWASKQEKGRQTKQKRKEDRKKRENATRMQTQMPTYDVVASLLSTAWLLGDYPITCVSYVPSRGGCRRLSGGQHIHVGLVLSTLPHGVCRCVADAIQCFLLFFPFWRQMQGLEKRLACSRVWPPTESLMPNGCCACKAVHGPPHFSSSSCMTFFFFWFGRAGEPPCANARRVLCTGD